MQVQIFGTRKSADTRKALRYFAERRIATHFVDLAERAASMGELRRFAEKFGVTTLVDRDARCFREMGLEHARLSDERWLERLVAEPCLLKIPLVRFAQRLTIGVAESEWASWLASAGAPAGRAPAGQARRGAR